MKRPPLRVAAPAVAALALAGFALGYAVRHRAARTPVERARDQRLAEAVRVLAYPITTERPLVLALFPEDREVKLLTNLEVPESALAAATAEAGAIDVPFAYGLRLEAVDAEGRVLWRSDSWEQTTKTRIEEPGSLVPREEAFLADPRLTATDTRAVQLLTEELCRRGARALRIRLLAVTAGPSVRGARVLARAFRAVDLEPEDARERWWKLGAERRQELVARANALPADLIADAERERLMRLRWQVIPAEPHGTEEHGTVPLYLVDLFASYARPPDELRQSAEAGPDRALAVNLVGPCDLWVEIAADSARGGGGGGEGSGGGRRPAVVSVVGLREDGAFVRRQVIAEQGLGGRESALLHLPVPPGAATVVIHPETAPAQVRFYVDQIHRLGEVEVARVIGPAANHWEVRPDTSPVVYFDCGPPGGGSSGSAGGADGAGVAAAGPAAAGPGGVGARGDVVVEAEVVPASGVPLTEVRISARIPIDPAGEREPRLALEVEVLDGQGALLARRSLEGAATASLYDTLWREADTGLLVSEPIYFLLRCPPDARKLRVRSPGRAMVAFFARLRPEGRLVRVPEDDPRSPLIRAAAVLDGRLRADDWFYYRPANQYELGSLGRSVRVLTQRRLFEERAPRERSLARSNFARALEPFAAAGGDDVASPAAVELWVKAASSAEAADDAPRMARPADRFALVPGRDHRVEALPPSGVGARPVPVGLTAFRAALPGERSARGRGAAAGGASAGAGAGAGASSADPREVLLLVYIGGAIAHQGLLAAGESAIPLGFLAEGRHAVRVELYARGSGDDEAFSPLEAAAAARLGIGPFLVDQPVLGDDRRPDAGALYQAKRATPLRRGAPLAVDLVKPGAEPIALHLQALAPTGDGGGGPGGRVGGAGSRDGGAGGSSAGVGAAGGIRDRVEVTLLRVGDDGSLAPIERRAYSIAREEEAGALAPGGLRYGRGRRFLLGLDAELPRGRYRAVLDIAEEEDGAAAGGPPLLVRAIVIDPRRATIGEGYFPRFSIEGPAALELGVPEAALRAVDAPALRLLARMQDADTPRAFERAMLEAAAVADAGGGGSAPAGAGTTGATSTAGERTHRIDVPAGLYTLTVGALTRPLEARFRLLDRGLDAFSGLEALGDAAAIAAEDLPFEVLPDEVGATYHRLDAGGAPLRFPLAAPTDRGAASSGESAPVRVVAAVLLERVDEATGEPFALVARFLGEDGAVLGEAPLAGEAITRRAVRDLDDPALLPSEPETWLAAPPAGARAIEIGGADRTLLVRVERARDAGLPELDWSPGDHQRPTGLRLAAPDGRGPRWRAVEPLGAEARATAGGRRSLRRARALIEAVESEPPIEQHGASLLPSGVEARRRFLEPLERGAIREPHRWGASVYAPLLAGDRARFRVLVDPALAERPSPGAGPGVEASLLYDLGDAVPEGELVVRVDGVVRLTAIPVEPKGRLALPGLEPGERELTIECGGALARFYVNLPPAYLEPVRPLRERPVFAIGRDRPVRVEVRKRADVDAVWLSGALYLPAAPAPGSVLEVTIAGGGRRAGAFVRTWTERRRLVALHGDASEQLVDLERFAPLERWVHPFRLTLGDDLAAGTYTIELTLVGVDAAEARLTAVEAGPAVREGARARALLGE